MKKQSFLKLILVALLGLAGFGVYLWRTIPTSGINRASLSRIREGMSQKEVEAIIGMPPGDYRSGSNEWLWRDRFPAPKDDGDWSLHWHADQSSIIVYFVDEKVVRKRYHIVSETVWDKILTWLHVTEPNEPLPMVYVY